MKDLKEDGFGYAIIVKPKEEESPKQAPILAKVQQLLDQFKDIICDGEPPKLPQKKAISH